MYEDMANVPPFGGQARISGFGRIIADRYCQFVVISSQLEASASPIAGLARSVVCHPWSGY